MSATSRSRLRWRREGCRAVPGISLKGHRKFYDLSVSCQTILPGTSGREFFVYGVCVYSFLAREIVLSVDFKWADILLKAGGNFALATICNASARNAIACTEQIEVQIFGWITAVTGIVPLAVGTFLIMGGLVTSYPWITRNVFSIAVFPFVLFVAGYAMQTVIAGNFSLAEGVCGDYFIPWARSR